MALMSIMRSSPVSPRCRSCAPRSNSNPDPTPDPDPQPEPEPEPESRVSISSTSDEQFCYYRITLPHLEAAKFDAALGSHREALVAEWKRDHAAGELGRLAPGYLADVIAVPGDPSCDIATTLDVRFVMKNGALYKN